MTSVDCWDWLFIPTLPGTVIFTFLIALPFEGVYHRRNGTIPPTSPNSPFRQRILIWQIQTRSECYLPWTSLATTMKPVISRLARMDIYISPLGTVFETQLPNRENTHRTPPPFSERSCGSTSTGRRVPDKIIWSLLTILSPQEADCPKFLPMDFAIPIDFHLMFPTLEKPDFLSRT